MKFDINFKIKMEEVKKSIIEEIKKYEDEVPTTEGIQELIKLHFIKYLIEGLEVKNDLINQCNIKIDFLRKERYDLSKNFIKQCDENKMLKAENEELKSKLDNMEQHTTILEEEKEEIKQLLKLKAAAVAKLKGEICKIKRGNDDLKFKMECNEDGSLNY